MTIEEIRQLVSGDVIPTFTATIQFVNEHKGKVQTLKLVDDAGESIKAVLITRPEVPASAKGKTVRIEKAIASDNTWNGKTNREVKILKGGVFELNGSVSHNEPTVKEFKEHVKEIVSGDRKSVYGGTAGCAVKLAVDVLLKACDGEGIKYYKSRQFSLDVYQISSDLVRVMQTIEEGKLAPSAKEREALLEKPVDNDKDAMELYVIEAAKEMFTNEDNWAQEDGVK